MRTKIFLVIISMFFTIGGLFNQSAHPIESTPSLNKKVVYKGEETYMKVNFYTIDRKKVNKGEYVGFAEFKENKLIVEVTDSKLEKLLKNPYTTMTGEKKNDVFIDKKITYQPNTLEHLKAIAIECYRFGYIGEIVKE